VLSKELDRAAKRAAKTIDAASAAVSVTSLFSKSVHGGGGGGGGGGKKKKMERQVKHGQGKKVEVVKEDAVKARKVEERQVKEVVEVAEEEVKARKVEEVEEVKSFIM